MSRPGKSVLSRGLCLAIAIAPFGVAHGQIVLNGAAIGRMASNQTVCILRERTLSLFVADATLQEIFIVDSETGGVRAG